MATPPSRDKPNNPLAHIRNANMHPGLLALQNRELGKGDWGY